LQRTLPHHGFRESRCRTLYLRKFRMANSEAMYVKVGPEDDDSQRMTKSRVFKVGMVLIGGSCLVLLSVMAISTFSPMVQHTSVAEATSLLGSPSSLRSAKQVSPMVPSLASLPGSSHWKKLALDAIAASNRCDRGVSLKAMLRNMDPASKDVVVKAAKGTITKMEDLQAGQTGPMGFFDPAGISANLDAGKILFYREAELKHGRVCMLASLGFLVGENFHPLFGGNIDVPSYIAFQETPLQAFWVAVLVAIGIPELQFSVPTFKSPVSENTEGEEVYKDADAFAIIPDRVPGDLGFDPLGLKPQDEAGFLEMQNKELNNGRLAMIAIAGMVAQELVSGEKVLAFDGKLR